MASHPVARSRVVVQVAKVVISPWCHPWWQLHRAATLRLRHPWAAKGSKGRGGGEILVALVKAHDPCQEKSQGKENPPRPGAKISVKDWERLRMAAVLDCSNPQKGSKRSKTGKPGIGTSGTYPKKSSVCHPQKKCSIHMGSYTKRPDGSRSGATPAKMRRRPVTAWGSHQCGTTRQFGSQIASLIVFWNAWSVSVTIQFRLLAPRLPLHMLRIFEDHYF